MKTPNNIVVLVAAVKGAEAHYLDGTREAIDAWLAERPNTWREVLPGDRLYSTCVMLAGDNIVMVRRKRHDAS